MKERAFAPAILITVLTLSLGLWIGCGGGGGGGSSPVTYNGSTDPAVADSTTAAPLAENLFKTAGAGFPVAQAFAAYPEVAAAQILAEPQGACLDTTLVVPTPDEAVVSGSDYAVFGTGTATLDGSLTLYMYSSNCASMSETWNVVFAGFSGTVTFDNFVVEDDGSGLSGVVSVSAGELEFTGLAQVALATGEFLGDPGFPVWYYVSLTFDNLTVDEGDEVYRLGQGDMEIYLDDPQVDLYVYSLTAGFGGKTYRLEDTNFLVTTTEIVPTAPPAAQPQFIVINETEIEIAGISDDYGTFYDHDRGVIGVSGYLVEDDLVNDVTYGYLNLSEDVITTDAVILFEYDDVAMATAYNVYVYTTGWLRVDKGYLVEGAFVSDPTAPDIPYIT